MYFKHKKCRHLFLDQTDQNLSKAARDFHSQNETVLIKYTYKYKDYIVIFVAHRMSTCEYLKSGSRIAQFTRGLSVFNNWGIFFIV